MHHDPKIERDDDRAGHARTSTSIWWPGARTSAILLLCCSSCRLAGSFTEQVTRDVQDCKPPLLFRIPLEICLNEDLDALLASVHFEAHGRIAEINFVPATGDREDPTAWLGM